MIRMILQNHIIPVNENGGLPLSKRYWAILATALGVGISVIDVTIANVALPTIAHDLGTSPSVTIWIVNAYQMAITISLLSFSSLGDIYGYRKIYLSGVLLFSITSGICACADSFWTLTTARILQGFGAAAMWIRRYTGSSIPNVFLVAEWASTPLSLPCRPLPDRQSLQLFSHWVHGIGFLPSTSQWELLHS